MRGAGPLPDGSGSRARRHPQLPRHPLRGRQGSLRFQPPAAPAACGGVRDAVAFGAAPPQFAPAPGAPPPWRPSDGLDCLTVNVWTPDLGAAGLPVLVWIYAGHGRSFRPACRHRVAVRDVAGVGENPFRYPQQPSARLVLRPECHQRR